MTFLLAFAALTLIFPADSHPASAHQLFETHTVAKHSGKCIDVYNGSTSWGAPVIQWWCHGGMNQQVDVLQTSDPNYHQLRFRHSNLCLDAPGGAGTQLIQWGCHSGDNQKFGGTWADTLDSFHQVKSTGLYLDVSGASTADGAAIIQWPLNGGNNQIWKTRQMYTGLFTGYAMGNLYGGGGVVVNQGHFANHSSYQCPGDPAAYWPYGTQINTVNSQGAFHYGTTGGTFFLSVFSLQDIGDFSCSQGNYWADLYFGRYKLAGQSCICDYVAGTCYDGAVNHCSDASNYGSRPGIRYYRP